MDVFLTRHFGTDFAQTFGSALVHGIYAADSRLLSTRAAFEVLYRLERWSGNDSVVRGALAALMSSIQKEEHDPARARNHTTSARWLTS